FSSRRRHTRCLSDWSSDVCSSDLVVLFVGAAMIAWGESCDMAAGGRLDLNKRWLSAMMHWTLLAVALLMQYRPRPPRRLVYALRSEERRVGKECIQRREGYHSKIS